MNGLIAYLRLHVTDDNSWTTTQWRYDAHDPLAFRVTFDADQPSTDPVVWHLDRQLLAAGLDGPAGHGDVRVWPYDRHTLAIALSTPHGQALLLLPTRDVVDLLRISLRLVPHAAEHEHLDVDGWIAAILAEESAR